MAQPSSATGCSASCAGWGWGYPIGSGTVESACKRVIAARLKQAGMRWTKAESPAALNLRTHLLLNGRGDAIWPLTHPQPSPA